MMITPKNEDKLLVAWVSALEQIYGLCELSTRLYFGQLQKEGGTTGCCASFGLIFYLYKQIRGGKSGAERKAERKEARREKELDLEGQAGADGIHPA
eukprot:198237-Pelagomonas_calceolata.AAC.4